MAAWARSERGTQTPRPLRPGTADPPTDPLPSHCHVFVFTAHLPLSGRNTLGLWSCVVPSPRSEGPGADIAHPSDPQCAAHHPSLKAVKPSPCAWSKDKAHAPHWSRVPMRFLMECFPKASRQALPQLRAGSAPGAPATDGDASLITDGLSVPRTLSDSRPF